MLLSILSEKKLITFIVALALFMDTLDATIINTAIPAMARSLQVNPVDLKIALISYLLSLAIFIPISGWLADKYGIKRIFILALSIFTLSSLWCGYAHQVSELVTARAIQGVGGALMLPLGRLIILRNFPRHEVVQAMSVVIMIVSFGIMLGPLAGGVITDHLSWHWIFWVNIPIGLLAIGAACLWLKESPLHKVRSFDFLGFLLFGSGLASLIYALSDFSESNVGTGNTLMILGVAVFLLCAYFLHPVRSNHHPIVDLTLFRHRTFQISVVGNLLARISFGALPFLLPLLMQVCLGYSAQLSGLLLAPVALGVLLVKVIFVRVLKTFGFRRLLLLNTFLVAFSLWSFQIVNIGVSPYIIALLTFIFGFLISLQYSGTNSLAYADLGTEDLSAATSVVSMVQQLSQSFGVATAALLLRYFSPSTLGHFLLTPQVFHQTFLTMGFLTFLCALIFLRLRPEDGHQMLKAPTQS